MLKSDGIYKSEFIVYDSPLTLMLLMAKFANKKIGKNPGK